MANAVGFEFWPWPADDTALAARQIEVFAASGARRVRIELPWSEVDFDRPMHFAAGRMSSRRAALKAARAHGLRPLVLLYGFEGRPVPNRQLDVRLTAPAAAGDRQVRLAPASIPLIIPGRSGFSMPAANDAPTAPAAANVLFSAVDEAGVATLSRPLPRALGAGPARIRVLRYQPFGRPRLSDGRPNPRFEETLAGWLAYVRAVLDEVSPVMGDTGFDLELWNRGPRGAAFLDVNNYYDPPLEADDGPRATTTARAILERTLAWLAIPGNAPPNLGGVLDGFSSVTWAETSESAVPGLAGIARHVTVRLQGATPACEVLLPEEPIVAGGGYDLFPEAKPSLVSASPMLRGAARARPGIWLTAFTIMAAGPGVIAPDARRWIQSKATLRAMASYVGAGVEALFFYGPPAATFPIFEPEEADGGVVPAAISRFLAAFAGATDIRSPRTLALAAVDACDAPLAGSCGGDPSARSGAVAFFPFQLDEHRFVIPVFVMSRDTPARGEEPPPQRHRIVVGAIDGLHTTVRAFDPLTGDPVAVAVIERRPDTVSLEIALTDYPRMLEMDTP